MNKSVFDEVIAHLESTGQIGNTFGGVLYQMGIESTDRVANVPLGAGRFIVFFYPHDARSEDWQAASDWFGLMAHRFARHEEETPGSAQGGLDINAEGVLVNEDTTQENEE